MVNSFSYKSISSESGVIGTVVGVIVALLLIAGAAFGVWYWQQQGVSDLNQQIEDLQNQVSQLGGNGQNNQNKTGNTQTGYVYNSEKDVEVEVYRPVKNATVTSPLTVMGQVPGNWSFEANFPVELRDSEGNTLAEGAAQLHGEWMTEEMVPFTVTFNFDAPSVNQGSLVLRKANPSDLPENDDHVTIPVSFR